MTNIINKIRDLIEDNLITTGRDSFEYLTSKIFTLTESNISSSTIKVYKNGSLWASSNYSYDSSTGKLTVTGTLSAGDVLEVTYSYYAKYSDTELKGFIRAAFTYISIEKYKIFSSRIDGTVFPTPSEDEEYLIALIASILIKGDIRSYRTPELTVTFNESDSKEKKIKKAVRNFKKAFGYLEYVDLGKQIVIEEEEE